MRKNSITTTTTRRRKRKSPTMSLSETDSLITVIMICDTPGYRMRSYGPPSLISINDNKLIDYQIKAIKDNIRNPEIILCVGYDSEKVNKYIRSKYSHVNIRVVENQIFNDSNTCEGMRLALNNTYNDKVIILDGNILFKANTLAQINLKQSAVLSEENPSDNLEIGFNLNESECIEHFAYGASKLWSEIFFLNNSDIIDSLRKIISATGYKTKFMFEALNDLVKTRHNLKMVSNDYPIQKINNIKTYHKVRGKR